jgi:phosphoenolpyruvate carboxykinase (ATP)
MSSTTERTFVQLDRAAALHRNLSVDDLIDRAVKAEEGVIAANGALVTRTGEYTGRTPNDKYVVREPSSEGHVWWENNQAMDPEVFEQLLAKANDFLAGKELYVVDTFGGADPKHRIRVRFAVQKAWHALFVKQLLIRPSEDELAGFQPDWTIVDLCELHTDPSLDGVVGKAVIALNFAARTVLIMGTQYAGEMKKSVFTILNYLLPLKGVLSMHCSANVGPAGDTALFFGLSGTGKTTLSADPSRRLIGDDEHGWTEDGIFNFEGGCYAKCIRLSRESEPQIWGAIRRGSVLENVILGEGGAPNYDSAEITENTRCAYPVDYIDGAILPSVGGHPQNIFFLTCDAFGVLPPISRLTPEQAMYHFLNGYTAKVAGTERGVTEPKVAFSTCFGAPFLPLRPRVYADLLGAKIAEHRAKVWLVNTGWSGGPFGVGERMKLGLTRALIAAAFSGALDEVAYVDHPIFGLHMPTQCPGVPSEVLDPRRTWSDPAAYDAKARELAAMFDENYRTFAQ